MKQEEEKNRLSSKEKLFCCHYVITGNAKESALRAGFSGNPQRDGAKLLSKKEINDEIISLFHQKEENFIHRACCGYERIAFGDVCDAIRLLYTENPSPELLAQMDLFNISEIKRLKDGAMEIKFFDRIRAMEKLQEIDFKSGNETIPFYRALEEGIQALQTESEK